MNSRMTAINMALAISIISLMNNSNSSIAMYVRNNSHKIQTNALASVSGASSNKNDSIEGKLFAEEDRLIGLVTGILAAPTNQYTRVVEDGNVIYYSAGISLEHSPYIGTQPKGEGVYFTGNKDVYILMLISTDPLKSVTLIYDWQRKTIGICGDKAVVEYKYISRNWRRNEHFYDSNSTNSMSSDKSGDRHEKLVDLATNLRQKFH